MDKILVSACLMGDPVRYNGAAMTSSHPALACWLAEGRLVTVCPELAGGLPVPRPAAEIRNGRGQDVLEGIARVVTKESEDVTDAFLRGAQTALAVALKHNVRLAILTEKSPSCGSRSTYDGNFNGTLQAGPGVTAALLEQNGIRVFNQHQLEEAEQFLEELQKHPLSHTNNREELKD